MGRLKSVMNWFVTIEDEEGEGAEATEQDGEPEAGPAPSNEESSDSEYEAILLASSQQEPSVSSGLDGLRVRDLGLDPHAGELDEASLMSSGRGADEFHTFDEIYGAADLPTEDESQQFTIFKIERMLGSEHLLDMSNRTKAASVMVALEASSVGLQEIIQDAITRDKALDNYDDIFRSTLKDLEDQIKFDNDLLETEVQEFAQRKRQEIAANNERLNASRMAYENWATRKTEEEQRLFDTVAVFVSENPITRD
jgi:hypothetical protein